MTTTTKIKIYGHPWSINTRKTLMTLAEKGAEDQAQLVLIMIPKGEQKHADHLARHPWGKVPVLEEPDGFTLLETRAINAYVDRRFPSSTSNRLIPSESRDAARVDQWVNIADSYFIPSAHSLIVEVLFRRYLGGEQSASAIEAGRIGVKAALDVVERHLESSNHPYLAGETFTLADIHWMPYLEYLSQIGEGDAIKERKRVADWWSRISSRPTWHKVARTGPQPYEPGMKADVIEKLYR